MAIRAVFISKHQFDSDQFRSQTGHALFAKRRHAPFQFPNTSSDFKQLRRQVGQIAPFQIPIISADLKAVPKPNGKTSRACEFRAAPREFHAAPAKPAPRPRFPCRGRESRTAPFQFPIISSDSKQFRSQAGKHPLRQAATRAVRQAAIHAVSISKHQFRFKSAPKPCGTHAVRQAATRPI